MSPTIVSAAVSGFQSSARYDAHRPSYPPASVNVLLDALRLSGQPGAHVLEIGAGTGIFSELLAARPEQFEVVAVEPHPDMRKVLEAKQLPRVRVTEDSATELSAVEDGWAEACIVAQVSAWIASVCYHATPRSNGLS